MTEPFTRRRFIATGLASATAMLAMPALLTRPALAKTASGISYGSNKLDIYPGPAGSPVLIYVHGGAWRAGSRGQVASLPAMCSSLGLTLVSVGYSLLSNVGQQAGQVGQAVHWIANNIGQYGGDPARIAISGHSAGCHLSSLATLSGLTPPLKCLIANDTAAYDVDYLAEINGGRLPILYAGPFSNRSKWRDWSPISYVAGAAGMPVMVSWSGGSMRPKVSGRFADALEAAGHPVSRFNGAAYNHLSIRSAMGKRGDPLTRAMTDFLSANL